VQQGGGDGTSRQGGHDQDGVADDRGIQPDLGLVEPEAVFAMGSPVLAWSVGHGVR
jgi:hypothetical protein